MSGLLFLVVFFGLLTAASAFGWTADSREHDDKSSTEASRWFARV